MDSDSQNTFDVISRNHPQLVAIGIENWDELIGSAKDKTNCCQGSQKLACTCGSHCDL